MQVPRDFKLPPRDMMIGAVKEIVQRLDDPRLRGAAIKASTSQIVVDGDTLHIDFGLKGVLPDMVAEERNYLWLTTSTLPEPYCRRRLLPASA